MIGLQISGMVKLRFRMATTVRFIRPPLICLTMGLNRLHGEFVGVCLLWVSALFMTLWT